MYTDYVSLADYANLGRELRMVKREKEELAHDKRKLIRELKGLDQVWVTIRFKQGK